MSALRRYGASFEGSLDEAYLGLDKQKFHRAARWEAGKTFVVCGIIAAVVVATHGTANLPLLVVACVLVPASTYYWTRYMVLEWRHDRLKSFCKKRAAQAGGNEVVALGEDEFAQFLQQPGIGERVRDAYHKKTGTRDTTHIFDAIAGTQDQISARQIYMGMGDEDKQRINRNDIRHELTQSDSAVFGCMQKKAIEEQQLRQMNQGGGGGGTNNVLTGALVGLDIINALGGLGDDD